MTATVISTIAICFAVANVLLNVALERRRRNHDKRMQEWNQS